MLEQVLEQDDGNEQAWLALASVTDKPRERRICLENVLEINPNNERARQALEKMRASAPSSGAGATPPAEPTRVAAPPVRAPTKRAGVTTPGAQDAWRSQRARQGLNPTVLFFILLSITLVGVGALLVIGNMEGSPTPTPRFSPTAAVAGQVGPTRTATQTPEPRGTIVVRESDPIVPPTWTPMPTATPFPTFTPSPTLPPLDAYTLVFVAERPDRPASIFTISAGGGPEQPLIVSEDPVADPAISPDGRRIAYVGLLDGQQQLFVANADGSDGRAITFFPPSRISNPAWSPDNNRIAFVSNDAGLDAIYLIDADGTNLIRPWESTRAETDPAWSPDGSQLAYAQDTTGRRTFQVFARSLAPDSRPVQLTEAGQNFSPAWSPDGTRIAFISTRTRQVSKVYIMRADGSDERILTFGDGNAENSDPAWSPDGVYVAFASNRNGGVFNIFIMTPDGGNIQQVTNQPGASVSPRFRPIP